VVFFTTISHCFSLEKKNSSKWIRLTFLVGNPKKRKKGELMVMIERLKGFRIP
jgi:hypothetical protein